MDNLFTINIDPDENVCLNDDKNKDEISKRAKYKNDKIDYIDADSIDLISYEINEIHKTDNLDTISELNDNQINKYQNIRKNIQNFIFKCFKEDDVVIGSPDISKDTFIEQLHLKNVNITLNKDKLEEIIAQSSRDKLKRNKQNELNTRYYCDKNIFDDDEISDKKFIDMLIGNDMSIDKINENKENEANKDAFSQSLQYNEENNQNENDDSSTQTINSPNDSNNGKNETLENEENAEKCDVITNPNNNIYENTLEPFKLNNLISEFGKKINNWLIKFPDIDCENFFFHLFFLSELHREKGSMCHNCGSHNMEKCSNINFKCESNYCFICDKHIPGYACHNTRAQYNYFKSNILKSLYDTRNFKYPNNIIPCLKCMSNDHYICGNPPYMFSQESYMFRKEFSKQFDCANYVYFKNSHNIWEIKDSLKNMVRKNNNNLMIRPPSPDDDNNNYQNKMYTNKNSMKRNISSDDYNNKNNIARYIDDNGDFANETGGMNNGIYKNKNKKRFKNNRNINIPRLKYDSEEDNESEIDNDEYDTEYNKHIHNNSTQLYKGKRGSDIYHYENNNNFNSNNKRRKRSFNDNNNYSDNNWDNENNNNVNVHRNLYNNNKHGNKMKHRGYGKNNKNTNYHYNKNFNHNNKKYDNNKKEQNSGYNNHNDSDNTTNTEPLLGFDTLENYMPRTKKSYSFLNNNYTKTNKNNASNGFSKNLKKNEYGGSSKHGFANNNNTYKGLYKNGNVNWGQYQK